MSEIWVVSEVAASMMELIAHARKLVHNESVVALALSSEAAQAAAKHGADQVKMLNGGQRPEAYVERIIALAQTAELSAMLWGTGKRAKEMAARVAAALDTGLINECLGVIRDDQEFCSERYIYGGLSIAGETSQTPFLATMSAKSIDPLPEGPVVDIEVLTGAEEACQVLELRPNQATSNLAEAKVVICVGRGFSKPEDIELAKRLAKKVGGELGCTRPVAEDLHWLPEEHYIGISGQVVKPIVYIGIGVSGQIQHVSGIRDSKTIIAIEKNENAPILEAADYALVGDLYEILPNLLSVLGA